MSSLLTPLALEQELSHQLVEASSGRPRAMSATIVIIPPQATPQAPEGTGSLEGDPAGLAAILRGRRPVRLVQARCAVAEEGIHASTRCAIDRQSRGVCIEDISIETAGDEAIDGALWGPFVIRDLPAILFWQRDLRELAHCADDCAHRVDLVLVDGESLLSCTDTVEDAAAFMKALEEEGLVVRDLAWERLFALRRSTVQLVAEGEAALNMEGGPESTISLTYNVPQPWSRSLYDAWLKRAVDQSGQNVLVHADASLAPWSIAVSIDGQLFRRESGTRSSDEGSILTRLIDRPAGDSLWSTALTALSKGNKSP